MTLIINGQIGTKFLYMYGQCKALDDGSWPTSVAQITSVRPVALTSILRRAVAGGIASALVQLTRPWHETLGQWGASIGGLGAAIRRQQAAAHP